MHMQGDLRSRKKVTARLPRSRPPPPPLGTSEFRRRTPSLHHHRGLSPPLPTATPITPNPIQPNPITPTTTTTTTTTTPTLRSTKTNHKTEPTKNSVRERERERERGREREVRERGDVLFSSPQKRE
jgi:hypothetical protein